jgi:hypothetical protein
MRALSDADVAAIRNAFNAVLAALPENRLRTLVLELLFAPFTMTTLNRKRGRPRKDVEEENVVPLHRHAGRRRKGAGDEAKAAERRARYAANRKAPKNSSPPAHGSP